jgi:ABC-type glycerol-3-phosphate transport system permease component
MNSLKEVTEYNRDAISFPNYLEWKNYAYAFKLEYRNTNVIGMFFNTVIYVATFSTASMVSSLMCAYALSRFKFRGRTFLYSLAVCIQIIPIFGSLGSSYLLTYNLGILDNKWLMWVSCLNGFDYTFLIIYSYFINVDSAYAEAARMDGANNVVIFVKIMIPMVFPSILVMWLSNVIKLWNDYTTPLIYLPSHPTLATGIKSLEALSIRSEGDMTAFFAAIIISMIPILLIFTITQRKIFNINVEGGIKG